MSRVDQRPYMGAGPVAGFPACTLSPLDVSVLSDRFS